MEIALIVLLALVVVVALALTRDTGRRARGPRHDDNPLHRGRLEADAEVEEHDIDGMLDAINERRRRREGREIGDELADELVRGTWDEDEKP